MAVAFNAARKGTDLRYVFDQVIPIYIRSFGAYFASVEDTDAVVRLEEKLWELSDEEHELLHNHYQSRRAECLHIWQVNYWAREQCSNYFGLTPEQIVVALSDHVARADVLEDGAYIVVSYDPMTSEEAEEITPTLMPLLRKRK